MTSPWPVRSNASFKPLLTDYIQMYTYFRMEKESGKLRESTSINLAVNLKIIILLDPRNSKTAKIGYPVP